MDRIRKGGFGKEEDETVYVTETGLVYHKDYHCTYLDLSIRMVQGKEISGLRNESGGRYYACEHCGGKGGGSAYITDYGDRYHSSLSCSSLKRTVYAVPLSEVIGKGACSKCVRLKTASTQSRAVPATVSCTGLPPNDRLP